MSKIKCREIMGLVRKSKDHDPYCGYGFWGDFRARTNRYLEERIDT